MNVANKVCLLDSTHNFGTFLFPCSVPFVAHFTLFGNLTVFMYSICAGCGFILVPFMRGRNSVVYLLFGNFSRGSKVKEIWQ